MNLLLESFFESYGLIIILVVAFALIMVYYYLRNRKFQQSESDFHGSLKIGDKVKTYSGFYGEVAKITNTTEGKIVTLKLGEGAYIDVDIRALMAMDMREELPEEPVAEEKPVEEHKEEVEEKPEEENEEKPADAEKELEEKVEEKEQKEKKPRKLRKKAE